MESKEKQLYEKYWQEFKHLLENGKKDAYHPFFYYYCRKLSDREQLTKLVLNVKYLFDLAKIPIEDQKILDVGCGFGVDAFILAALGAKEVHGIDVNEDWVETTRQYLQDLKWDLNIKVKQGDASDIPYPENSFDVAISQEAISHYRDAYSFLKEAHRVLRVGGVLIISDGNNAANPMTRKKTYEIWERFEHGPPAENFHGHRIEKPYREMRREIITENFPQIEEQAVDELVDNTFGIGKEEIERVCQTYVEKGDFPKRKFERGVPAFNPIMNDYIERLFDPADLSDRLEELGFKVKAYAHFGGAGRDNLMGKLNAVLRTLSPLTMYAARAFKIVAVKER